MKSFSKKGVVELTLTTIFGFVLALFSVIFITGIIIMLVNVFSSGDSGSEASLDSLFNSVQLLYSSPDTQSCFIAARFLDENLALVGFNADNEHDAINENICVMGRPCIKEDCGAISWSNNVINKPRSCGHGPCLCLCSSGGRTGIGDLGSDDCSASGAKCLKFPQDSVFKSFYLVKDDCPFSVRLPTEQADVCDLVFYGESCSGTKTRVDYTTILHKSQSRSGSPAVVVEVLSSADRILKYPDIIGCNNIPHQNSDENSENTQVENQNSIQVS